VLPLCTQLCTKAEYKCPVGSTTCSCGLKGSTQYCHGVPSAAPFSASPAIYFLVLLCLFASLWL
jgi:hypothetical protein